MGMFRPVSIVLVSATMLVACTGTPVAVNPSASPSVVASTSATASPATSAPGGSAAPQTSAAPSADTGATSAASAAPVSGETGIIKGQVYDATGALVPDQTVVTLKSLDPAHPYTASVTTNGGNYVANAVPLNVQLEVSATRTGWTTRSRVLVLRQADPRLTNRNTYNFGGPTNADDPAGSAFFISDYPEIDRVEPVDEDTSLPNDKMRFKIVMSEPLDVANQRRLGSAFLLIPNNQEAMGEYDVLPDETATSAGLSGLRGGADPLTNSVYRYRQNAGFLGGLAVSSFKWDDAGQSATFELAAPVKTNYKKEGEYAFVLVHQDDQKIVDKTGQPLGMDANGKWGNYIKGGMIFNAIRKSGLVLAASVGGKDEDRWRETHQTWTKFSVARDSVAPKVVSVVARRNYVDDSGAASDRVEFTFSEPMVAFPKVMSRSLLSLNNYVFTAASTEDALTARSLGSTNKAVALKTTADFKDIRDAINSSNGFVTDSDSDVDRNFVVKLSVNDPKVVIFQMPSGSLPLDANFIKAYAGSDANASSASGKSVADPAGNDVDPTANTAVGPIY